MFCPGRRPTSTHCVISRDTGLRKSGPAAVCPARVMFTHGGPVPESPSAPRINAHSAIQGSFVLKWLSPGCCWAASVLSMAPGQAGYPKASNCPTGLSLDRLAWLGEAPAGDRAALRTGEARKTEPVRRPEYNLLPLKASLIMPQETGNPCNHIAALLWVSGQLQGFRPCWTLKPR